MIIRKIDDAGDWRFGKGNSDYARDDQAIAENIQTRVLSWVGDCFFALQDGVDWKSRLDSGQQAALVSEIKAVILRSFGVVAINSFSFSFEPTTRNLSVSYNIQTIYSQSFLASLSQAIGLTGA